MVIQEKDRPIWKACQAQGLILFPWAHETIGGEVLVYLLSSGQLDFMSDPLLT